MQTQLSGTYEDIIRDFRSLLDRFDERIMALGKFARNQEAKPSVSSTESLNRMKLERAKVKQIWMDMQTMTEGQVLDLKEQYDEDFKAAQRALEEPSDSMQR